jgi:adenylyl-sulfate kinase
MRKGFVVWLTGLSGAGKTTIAQDLSSRLRHEGWPVEVLDGDAVRELLGKGLGFSREDRDLNVRRIAFVAHLLSRNGVAVIVSAISPFRSTRDEARELLSRFVEVHVQCPIEELLRRDTKGLYARAVRGEIANFTGISDPYEKPLAPEVVVRTDLESLDESVERIWAATKELGYLRSSRRLLDERMLAVGARD